jgi:phosphoserine aminotransferase
MAQTSKAFYNFNSGPATLPSEVLKQIKAELTNWDGTHASVMELSHRGANFLGLMQKIKHNIKCLLDVPNHYHILFMQGGARTQFSAIAQNFLGDDGRALYLTSGLWSEMAAEEAKKFASIDTQSIVDTEAPLQSTHWPQMTASAAQEYRYVHCCPNETLDGLSINTRIQSPYPVIADMTSCLFSQPIEVSDYGLIYASAQKNIGIAGVTLVIVDQKLLQLPALIGPSTLDYRLALKHESMYSTPATFSIYVASLVVQWLLDFGGLIKVAEHNQTKAAKLYHSIDESKLFSNRVDPRSRSLMNVTFTTQDTKLDERFYFDAEQAGLIGLQGHRAVGGLRASIYNAMPNAGVDALIDFMAAFEQEHRQTRPLS